MNRSILTCLAIDKPADVIIDEALRDAPKEHTLQLKAPNCRTV